MPNTALDVNPVNATFAMTRAGSSFAWAWFAFMTLLLLCIIGSLFAVRRSQRTFHRLAVLIVFIYVIYYFCIAADLGATPIAVEFRGGTPRQRFRTADGAATRQIWYVRWVSYSLVWPLVVYMLLLATGRPVSEYVVTIGFTLVYAVCFLIGALVRSSYKWGFFTIGLFAMFCAVYELLVPGLRSVTRLGRGYRTPYLVPAATLAFLWMIYPIAWGLAEGGNVISVNSDIVFYGIIDLVLVTLVVMAFLGLVSKVDHSTYDAHRWGDGDEDVLWEKSARHRDSTSAAGRDSVEATGSSTGSTAVRATDHARSRQTAAAGAPAQSTTRPVTVPVGPVAPPLETAGQQSHQTTTVNH